MPRKNQVKTGCLPQNNHPVKYRQPKKNKKIFQKTHKTVDFCENALFLLNSFPPEKPEKTKPCSMSAGNGKKLELN